MHNSDREAQWVLQLSNTTSSALYHTKCAQSTDLEPKWVLQLTNTTLPRIHQLIKPFNCYEAIFNLNLVELRNDSHAYSTIGLATPVVPPLPNRGSLLPSQTPPPSLPLSSYPLQVNA